MSPELSGLQARLSGRCGAMNLDVELSAPAHGVTGLVGPSGAGKSTVLRALAGLERLHGAVRMGGVIWQDEAHFLAPHLREVGYVFQQATLLPHLSVLRNLQYGWRRTGGDAETFERVLALLHLRPLLERSPSRLSGGERQRVAVGRALLTRPRLLLLDEPLSGMDADAKAALLPELKAAFDALAVPVIYVSHDMAEVAALAERTIHLRAGRIMELGNGRLTRQAADSLDGFSPEQIARLADAALRAGVDPDG